MHLMGTDHNFKQNSIELTDASFGMISSYEIVVSQLILGHLCNDNNILLA